MQLKFNFTSSDIALVIEARTLNRLWYKFFDEFFRSREFIESVELTYGKQTWVIYASREFKYIFEVANFTHLWFANNDQLVLTSPANFIQDFVRLKMKTTNDYSPVLLIKITKITKHNVFKDQFEKLQITETE
jgi:hypothetical protein